MAIKEATFGNGCFWCSEPIFKQLKGVLEVIPGYAGGHIKNPAYREVCEGRTGHAEVLRVSYDDEIISFDELLEIFWFSHDPTTLNRQGNDVGEQYRSAVFYHDENQRKLAKEYKEKLQQTGAYSKPIVTEITPLTSFYKAEKDHWDYYNNNPDQGYCFYVIRPKIEKFEQAFKHKLKDITG
ncbi:MAG TPA: peptide-methionine (S)-S-oxide reductase MsrA [Brumimicrobium sp.]|nr:peptide-methionine (S)-S-oxide reductase MsrA [Brumimicrobium sp.]